MRLLLTAYLPLALTSLLLGALLTLQSFEHRRFTRSRLHRADGRRFTGRTVVFIPCKGLDLELEQNLRPLLTQQFPNYEVRFLLEHAEDPARPVIERLLAEHPGRGRILIAGRAEDCGQKVHNLRAGTAELPADVEALAFADSDARPGPHWLASLTAELAATKFGAVSGYRWMIPLRATPANLLLSRMNNALTPLFSCRAVQLLWGGTWSVRREHFEAAEVREAWQGTLSDDLVACRTLAGRGVKIDFEPRCVVASPIDYTWSGACEFISRQLIITRVYAPRWWALGGAGMLVNVLAFWFGLALLLASALGAIEFSWLPAVLWGATTGLTLLRGWWWQDAGRASLRDSGLRQSLPARFLELSLAPFGDLLGSACLLHSAFRRTITWRGITYRLYPGGRCEIVTPRSESVFVSVNSQVEARRNDRAA